jgi:hypothetical protein
MPWGFAAAAAGAIGGAMISSNATDKAANTQAQSTKAGIDAQTHQYDTTRADQAPYRAAGTAALGQLASENNVPLDPNSVQTDPGYQFARQQGQEAIDRKAAAAGGRISGAALKAASEYNTNYATTGYSTAYNRVKTARDDRLNRLAALAGIGQTATQQVDTAGRNTANQISSLTTAQGNAAGAAQISQGNIWQGAGNQLAALYGRYSGTPSSGYSPSYTSGPVNMGSATGDDMSAFYA